MTDTVGSLPGAAFVAVEANEEPAVLISRDYRILAANAAYRARYRPDLALGGDRCHDVSHRFPGPCDQHGETCPLRRCLETDGPARVLHVHHTTCGPEHVDVSLEPVRGPDGAIVGFLERIHTVRSTAPGVGELIGRSPAFHLALAAVQRVAPTEIPVLLLGESGTGKELFARAVHAESARAEGPFTPIECSGLTESLFESELFGHEAGSFTGARGRKPGLVEAARGGTLFLDEIGDVPLGLQVKLLRLLETRSYRRVGSIESEHADFRLVCATHADLRGAVEAGRFRLDLFHRINGFPIRVPALRDRRADIPRLAARFLEGTGKTLGPDALFAIQALPLHGNVRELKNLVRRGAILADGPRIGVSDLALEAEISGPPAPDRLMPLAEAERAYLTWARDTHRGDRADLARQLGVSERTLFRKFAELE